METMRLDLSEVNILRIQKTFRLERQYLKTDLHYSNLFPTEHLMKLRQKPNK